MIVVVLVTSPKAWSHPWLVPTRMMRKRSPSTTALSLELAAMPAAIVLSVILYSRAAGVELMISPMMVARLVHRQAIAVLGSGGICAHGALDHGLEFACAPGRNLQIGDVRFHGSEVCPCRLEGPQSRAARQAGIELAVPSRNVPAGHPRWPRGPCSCR